MFTIKDKKSEVNSFTLNVENSDFTYNSKNGKSFFNNNEIFSDVEKKNISLGNNIILFYSNEKKIYSNKLKLLYKLNNNEFIIEQNDISTDKGLFIAKGEINNKTFQIDFKEILLFDNYKLSHSVVLKETINIIIFSSKEYIIYKENINEIGCIDKNGNLLWFKSIDSYKLDNNINTSFSFLNVYNNQIIISYNNHTILSININNGKLLNKWKELPNINPKTTEEGLIPDSKSFVLDKKSGKLLGALHENYIEIDLKTKAIHFVDIAEELQKHEIIFIKQLNNNPFTETHLFLTAMMQQDDTDKKWSKDCLFALNRESLKIDWLHVFEDQSLGTNIPKITKTELYQLDNDGTLHIFKKDKNSII